jgi:hypothetical protein
VVTPNPIRTTCIPQAAGLEVAYRYQPASQVAEIGGDWFDVVPLECGQVALVVGDVTGHGIRAAAIMGQLRTTATALARLGCPPGQVMRQLNGVLAAHGEPRQDLLRQVSNLQEARASASAHTRPASSNTGPCRRPRLDRSVLRRIQGLL